MNNHRRHHTPKIAILGGGIAGLSLAYHLLHYKVNLHLYHGRSSPMPVSHLAQGVATLKGYHLARKSLFAAKMYGHRQLLKLFSHTGFKHYTTGVREIFPSAAAYRQQTTRTYHRRFRGFCNLQTQNLADTWHNKLSLYPMVHDYPDDYTFAPRAWCDHLQDYLLTHQAYQAITTGLLQPADLPHCGYDHVVVALGAYTPQWLRGLHLYSRGGDFCWPGVAGWLQPQGPAAVARTEAWRKQVTAGMASSPLWGLKQGTHSLRIHHLGPAPRYYVGSYNAPKQAPHARLEPDPQAQQQLHQLLRRFGFPVDDSGASTSAEPRHLTWGLRYSGKNTKPIVGEMSLAPTAWDNISSQPSASPAPRLWLFCGFHKSGYSLAPALSAALAEQLMAATSGRPQRQDPAMLLRYAALNPHSQFTAQS